ncbi:hypothetical protein C3Z13_08755 [Avibacterium endocarditidis]|uniref:Uncharacterized protein n=1 Tax=Avibacterium endocarditidis TaxID=380674 RepID=A0ABX4ZR34_9PAST|nr:hypothetical protein C3Z13_08755 [Avibacterium endocarditidis]
MLVETELGQYQSAQAHLARYRQKFGNDASAKEAQTILLDKTQPDLAKLGRWQDQLKQDPSNHKLALELYRLASRNRILPLQQSLMAQYPALFNTKDKTWAKHSEIIANSKGDNISDRTFQQNYDKLSKLLSTIDRENPLYQLALQDRLVLAAKLNRLDWVKENYTALGRLGKPMPAYTKEAYADTLLASGSSS